MTRMTFKQPKTPKSGLRALASASFLALALSVTATPQAGLAQNLYAPVIRVDDAAISAYERSQRIAFLRLLRAPGDVAKIAEEQLITESLQNGVAERMGISITPEALQAGMEEFAARGGLDAETFLKFIAQGGIAAETFRDFVSAGLTWREVARARFIPQVNVTKLEVERAFAEADPVQGDKLLLTEITLPAPNDASRKASRARADRLRKINDASEFANAAKRFSVAPSRLQAGERDWIDLQALPPEIGAAVRGLKAGQTSRPIDTEDGVSVYFLRDRDRVTSAKSGTLVEYAAFLMPGGRSEATLAAATKLRGEVDSCNDLYPVARGLPQEMLVREEVAAGLVPTAYRAELAKLDPGEVSTALTSASGQSLVFLMLCNRRNDLPKSMTREQILNRLRDQRIGALANDFLVELRADAHIEYLK
ncbi:MAG: peptidylprolyl isomerase [Maritimibacter sp.]